jgi:hypothetical protein
VAQGAETEPESSPVDLCLRCAHPLDPLQNFCPHCGAPTGYAASLPFEHELVFGQTLGMIFRRACLTSGVRLRRRALDVFVLVWVVFWPLFVVAETVPIRFLVVPFAVLISLLLVVSGLLLHRLLRRRD